MTAQKLPSTLGDVFLLLILSDQEFKTQRYQICHHRDQQTCKYSHLRSNIYLIYWLWKLMQIYFLSINYLISWLTISALIIKDTFVISAHTDNMNFIWPMTKYMIFPTWLNECCMFYRSTMRHYISVSGSLWLWSCGF